MFCIDRGNRANIQQFNKFVAIIVDKERVITPNVMEARPSKAHGTGMFAVNDIACGTVLCVTGPGAKDDKDPDYCDESELINDLNYTHCRRNIGLDKEAADYTYEDYQTMIDEYCNLKAVPQYTNVVVSSFNKKFFVEAHRDIQAGEELSRLYTVQFWLNYHLTKLMAAEDKSIYDRKHPLIKSMMELTDPYSLRCFAAVLNFHASDEKK
jgi:hypothetical protein